MSGQRDDETNVCTPTVHSARHVGSAATGHQPISRTTEVKQPVQLCDLLATRPLPVHDERRSEERWITIKPAKVYDHRADRYFAAQTCNLSVGGALLKVVRSMPIAAGDRLNVTIGDVAEGPVIALDNTVESKVVRVTPMDPYTQAVAVQYRQANHNTADLIPATRKPVPSYAAA